jgi:hypothetical protein
MTTTCHRCGHEAREIRACGDRREYQCPHCRETFIKQDGNSHSLFACLACDLEGIIKPKGASTWSAS